MYNFLKRAETSVNKDSLLKDQEFPVPNVINYYCSLCGSELINTDKNFERLPRRKTDDSMILEISSKMYFHNKLKKDKLIVIKRDFNKYEKQYRYLCGECGVFVAYQALDYDVNDCNDELKKRSNKIFFNNKKKIIYVLMDAVVPDPRQSSLFIELEKLNEAQSKTNTIFKNIQNI